MRDLLVRMLTQVDVPIPYIVRFGDGSEWRHGSAAPVFVIHFRTDDAVRELLTRASLGFGEAYMRGEIDLEGDVQEVARLGYRLAAAGLEPTWAEKLKVAAAALGRRNTLAGSRRNIAAHYDLGNDFYALWLDEQMQYTCAYFESPDDSLEAAQRQKMDLVCKKLRLNPGETLVEAGCGWGALALHAAMNYGVKVRAYNISKEQIAWARERAQRLGVGTDRLEYVLDDYRAIDGTYDKLASVGMLEHVGVENYERFWEIVRAAVKPRGLALVHFISRGYARPTDPWLQRYIFPGAHLPSLGEVVPALERLESDLHVVDVENLRYHYALTLDHWHRRFERHVDRIRAQYGEPFVRMFRLYLRSAAASFRYNGLLLFQVLASRGYDDGAPLTRRHLFAPPTRD